MSAMGEFKICPFCREQIRAEAVKCRFCGEWLERQLRPDPPTHPDAASLPPSDPAPPVNVTAERECFGVEGLLPTNPPSGIPSKAPASVPNMASSAGSSPVTLAAKNRYPIWVIALGLATAMTLFVFAQEYLPGQRVPSLFPTLYVFPLAFLGAYIWLLVDRQEQRGEFKITGWKRIFYIIGYCGFINLLFWLMAYGRYAYRKSKSQSNQHFFGSQFQSLLFIWGVWILLVVLALVIGVACIGSGGRK
jgi:hypothetical protein